MHIAPFRDHFSMGELLRFMIVSKEAGVNQAGTGQAACNGQPDPVMARLFYDSFDFRKNFIGVIEGPDMDEEDLAGFIQDDGDRVRGKIQGLAKGVVGVGHQGEGHLVKGLPHLYLGDLIALAGADEFQLVFQLGIRLAPW